jgi:hypothetical protein
MTEPMGAVAGTWNLTIATPVGKLPVTLELHRTEGVLQGTATSRHETIALQNLVAQTERAGTRLTWSQSVTRPMRLNLTFDVLATGDTLTGISKAGRLPRSAVTGRRETTPGPSTR